MMTIHLTLIKKNPLTLQVLLAQKLGLFYLMEIILSSVEHRMRWSVIQLSSFICLNVEKMPLSPQI